MQQDGSLSTRLQVLASTPWVVGAWAIANPVMSVALVIGPLMGLLTRFLRYLGYDNIVRSGPYKVAEWLTKLASSSAAVVLTIQYAANTAWGGAMASAATAGFASVSAVASSLLTLFLGVGVVAVFLYIVAPWFLKGLRRLGIWVDKIDALLAHFDPKVAMRRSVQALEARANAAFAGISEHVVDIVPIELTDATRLLKIVDNIRLSNDAPIAKLDRMAERLREAVARGEKSF